MAKIILMGKFTANGQPWFEYANNKKEFLFTLDKIYSNVQANGFVHKIIIKGNSIPKYILNECDPSFIVENIELVKEVK